MHKLAVEFWNTPKCKSQDQVSDLMSHHVHIVIGSRERFTSKIIRNMEQHCSSHPKSYLKGLKGGFCRRNDSRSRMEKTIQNMSRHEGGSRQSIRCTSETIVSLCARNAARKRSEQWCSPQTNTLHPSNRLFRHRCQWWILQSKIPRMLGNRRRGTPQVPRYTEKFHIIKFVGARIETYHLLRHFFCQIVIYVSPLRGVT